MANRLRGRESRLRADWSRTNASQSQGARLIPAALGLTHSGGANSRRRLEVRLPVRLRLATGAAAKLRAGWPQPSEAGWTARQNGEKAGSRSSLPAMEKRRPFCLLQRAGG